jgi:chorismate mutase
MAGTVMTTMIDPVTSMEPTRMKIIRELRELIVALDRRMPQVERVGEVAIARAAAGLRIEALRRIEELERGTPIDPTPAM